MARLRNPGDFRGGLDIDPFGMTAAGGRDDLGQPTGGYHDKGANDGIIPDSSRSGQGPRERPGPPALPPPPPGPNGPDAPVPSRSGEGARELFAPKTPMFPAPQAGSSSMATSGGSTDSGATSTFSPLASPAMGMMTSARRSLYGKAGGLLGGGLGAQDTTSNNMSDPISSLIAILQKRNGGF